MASLEKSPPVTIEKIDSVLKKLKNNKARCPLGLVNELFKEGVIGNDLKESIVENSEEV